MSDTLKSDTLTSETPASDYDAARYARKGRGKIYDSILDTIGDTPLIRLPRLSAELKPKGEVVAKLEFFNPINSVKDRIGVAMIEALEHKGLIKAGTTIVEPTSGNTGIALAFVAAAKGYTLILVMPESMSMERRKMLALLGAKLELTPAEKGMRGAVARAQEIVAETPGAVMPQQFENAANPLIHRVSTAEEIWNDTDDRRRTRSLACALRRRAGAAQDPGHRRGLRARHPRPRRDRRGGAGLQRRELRDGPPRGAHRRRARGHLLRRGPDGGLSSGVAGRVRRQAGGGDHPELRRTLSLHGAVRRALIPSAFCPSSSSAQGRG
jgi:hypothetical protein